MNKQEALKKIEKLDELTIKDKDFNFDIEMIPKVEALEIVNQLEEPVKPPEPEPLKPEKPVVPQFVDDWYEENKYFFECNLYELFVDFNEGKLQGDLRVWFADNNNKPIETLVMIHKFGYEVEKEKLYTVEMPNPNSKGTNKIYLCKDDTTGKVYLCKGNFNPSKNKNLRLTESEIKEDFEWAWQFAEEVKK